MAGNGTGGGGTERSIPRIRRYRRPILLALIATLVTLAAGLSWTGIARRNDNARLRQTVKLQNPMPSVPATGSAVFTTAHPSFAGAVREFFGWQRAPVQPIAFNHKIHLQKGLQCTTCHTGVTQGPDAGIPAANFCMVCHQVIAAQQPEIKKLAAYAAKGQDVPWQRVYWFYPNTHVRFWHSPHIHAGLSCDQCHGNVAQQTVAVRSTDLTMNFCLNCHVAKRVSVECTTCHF
jgi:formamidopyrimidine-DNA glycosylase